MLKNLLKIAVRNLLKRKVYTLINVLGLAISMAACLLIVLYLKHETSYDKFFPDGDRIFKMALERKYPNHSTYFSAIPHSYAGAMQNDFPEVENNLHMLGPNQGILVTYEPENKEKLMFEENNFFAADSSFFSFFDLPMVKGDKRSALAAQNQVIISESIAKKYFGNDDPIGKVFQVNGFDGGLKVTGVFKDIPDNSHLTLDFVSSFNSAEFRKQENYIGFDSHTYVKLKKGADYKALEAKFPDMVNRYASGQIERELKQSWADYQKAGNGYRYFLQPLTSIHLDPTNLEFTISPSGNIRYVYGLGLIAVLILAIACINFMNLATARSAERAREVGLRKVMGSVKNQLVFQFLVEAIVLTFIGTLIAVVIAYVLLPSFNVLVGKNLHMIFSIDVIGGLLAFAMLVGLLAGTYPAFVLSSYNPVEVMKGKLMGSSRGQWLRNGLVVFQFIISIMLIVGTVVVNNQMEFMLRKDLGFSKERMLMVDRAFALRDNQTAFIEDVKRIPGVVTASGTNSRVGNRDDVFGQMFQPEGSTEVLTVKTMVIDDEFASDIGFRLKDGRFFSHESNDSLNLILNETAVRTIGLKDPVGKKLLNSDLFRGDPERDRERFFTIIGVVEDFHFQSLRDEITPLVMYSREIFGKRANHRFVAIRLKDDNYQATIAGIEQRWKQIVPDRPFRYEFLEDNLRSGYSEEERSGKVFQVFSGLAIIIACVGLFGLSAYTASLRVKEIGIRKVLGASSTGVVLLLSKDFTKLVLLAFVIAAPVSWYLMNNWLHGFAYRVTMGVGTLLLAGGVSLLIAWLTISFQSLKAASVNPVISLKSE